MTTPIFDNYVDSIADSINAKFDEMFRANEKHPIPATADLSIKATQSDQGITVRPYSKDDMIYSDADDMIQSEFDFDDGNEIVKEEEEEEYEDDDDEDYEDENDLKPHIIFANGKISNNFCRYSVGSAGFDLCAYIESPITLKPNESVLVSTGVRVWLRNPLLVAKCYPRSGLGSKGLVLKNLTGIIDSDYQGEIKLCLWNTSSNDMVINPYDRVAQLLFEYVAPVTLKIVDSFESDTDRGSNGFGSTGSQTKITQ